MAIGWLFHFDANSYLVAGVPLVVFFQLFVRKKPLATLWVRDAARFRLGVFGKLCCRNTFCWRIAECFPAFLAQSSARSPAGAILTRRGKNFASGSTKSV
jgi:hypothetical protein